MPMLTSRPHLICTGSYATSFERLMLLRCYQFAIDGLSPATTPNRWCSWFPATMPNRWCSLSPATMPNRWWPLIPRPHVKSLIPPSRLFSDQKETKLIRSAWRRKHSRFLISRWVTIVKYWWSISRVLRALAFSTAETMSITKYHRIWIGTMDNYKASIKQLFVTTHGREWVTWRTPNSVSTFL